MRPSTALKTSRTPITAASIYSPSTSCRTIAASSRQGTGAMNLPSSTRQVGVSTSEVALGPTLDRRRAASSAERPACQFTAPPVEPAAEERSGPLSLSCCRACIPILLAIHHRGEVGRKVRVRTALMLSEINRAPPLAKLLRHQGLRLPPGLISLNTETAASIPMQASLDAPDRLEQPGSNDDRACKSGPHQTSGSVPASVRRSHRRPWTARPDIRPVGGARHRDCRRGPGCLEAVPF